MLTWPVIRSSCEARSSVRALSGQPRAVLRNFVIDPDGSFVHWPDLDVHLGWNQFLQAVDPEEGFEPITDGRPKQLSHLLAVEGGRFHVARHGEGQPHRTRCAGPCPT